MNNIALGVSSVQDVNSDSEHLRSQEEPWPSINQLLRVIEEIVIEDTAMRCYCL